VGRRLDELRNLGFRTIDLKGRIPDGIAVRDGKIIAVEVLTRFRDKRGHVKFNGGTTIERKKHDYAMFDEVLVFTFDRDKAPRKPHSGSFVKAMNILHPI
jgi:hypothetical protein